MYTAPIAVTRDSTWSMNSAVRLPGRMPGMKPPDRLMLSATSTGLITMAV